MTCESHSVVSDSLRPRGILQVRILEWVAVPFSRDRPNPGIQPRSPALQVGSSPAEAPVELDTSGWPLCPGGGSPPPGQARSGRAGLELRE